MTKNLMNYVSEQFSDSTVSSISSMIGENAGTTKSAISAALPTVLKGIINRGDTAENVASLKKFIADEKIDNNLISNLSKGDFLSKGSGVVDYLFGSAKDSLLGNAAKLTGLKGSTNSSLLSAIAPMALSYVSKLASSENMNNEQLASYLNGQKGKLMNVASTRGGASSSTSNHSNSTTTETSSGGGGLLKWLIPLLLILGALWWFMNRDKSVDASSDGEVQEIMEDASGNNSASATMNYNENSSSTTSGTESNASTNGSSGVEGGLSMEASADGSTEISYSVDANGNLVDSDGKIIAKAGEFSVKDGQYFDAEGNKIGFLKKVGQAIGGAATKTADAIGGAAVKSAEKMKEVFTGIFKSKEKIGTNYSMDKIVFDTESHRITNFSKGEVEGLAAALKDLPGAKIQVQVHADDGKSVSEKRANVVRDMLVTLGVSEKQISFKGMGDGDKAKAAEGKVEIKVEQTVD